MTGKERYLDELMEEMKEEKETMALIRDLTGEYVPISAPMLREVMRRSEAAESKEEGDRILEDFFNQVVQGKITPYE